ncbi:hypothetical protein [Streptomyces sp. AgN23]|uniref:hypothetical protein n=1 Tax=Streptomyces sp. AgN23 TaxID=1188315 RepID=UPI001B329CAD|nr:hypothetical protein [Streptomyces sp. AgN23]QTI87384.1 hypothetical protein AS97_40780 [Streptomyces sp. AgN23]
MPYSPVTKADSGIRGVKDPREKTVAVTSVGSLPDIELCKAAADADIPYKDLKVINGGGGASIVAAIGKGAAAGMVSDPQLTQLVRSGTYRIVGTRTSTTCPWWRSPTHHGSDTCQPPTTPHALAAWCGAWRHKRSSGGGGLSHPGTPCAALPVPGPRGA